MARNNIKKFEKLDDLGGTPEELWISYNQIEKLSGLDALTSLKLLYIGNNKIKKFDELSKLADMPNLKELLLEGNPIYEGLSDEECRIEVAKRLPNLQKLDSRMISAETRAAATAVEEEG
eukprot:114059_1